MRWGKDTSCGWICSCSALAGIIGYGEERPAGVLTFGRLTKPLDGERTLRVLDRLRASPVRMREAGKR